MRILVLSNLYPPNAMGGYELSCRDVVDRWRWRGHEVTVLTTGESVTGVVKPTTEEPHVRRSLQWYWSEHAFLRPPLRDRLAIERANLAVLEDALAQGVDVVSVWHLGGMPLGLLGAVEQAGVPAVLNICDDWPDYGLRADAWTSAWARLPRAVRASGAALLGVPTSVPDLDAHPAAFVSAFTRESLRRRTSWTFPDSEVVGSGVDTDDFPWCTRDLTVWQGNLLCVGRVEPRKGFGTAIESLAVLPDARLRIVGVADPSHLTELLRLAEGLGVTDRLTLGPVPRSELRDVYRWADVLLFPSVWEEPFGLVPLEAMTQGTPVVATRRGGSAEYLTDGANCLEVPAADAQALATAVRRLAAEPELRAALAGGGRRTAAVHTVDRLAERLEALHARAATVA
ncbi:MAG: glycosyltransferase family 4 protein [Mycobacteriales bacterium]